MESSCAESNTVHHHYDRLEKKWKTAYPPTPTIYSLSDELLSRILAFVPYSPQQYRSLLFVSKRLKQLVDDDTFRKQIALATYPLRMNLWDFEVVTCKELWWCDKEDKRFRGWVAKIAPDAQGHLFEIILLGLQVFGFLSDQLSDFEKAKLQPQGYRLRVIECMKKNGALPNIVLRLLRYAIWRYFPTTSSLMPDLLKEGPTLPSVLTVPYDKEEIRLLLEREIHDLRYMSWRCFIEYAWLVSVREPGGESVLYDTQSDIATHAWQQFSAFTCTECAVPCGLDKAFSDRDFFESGHWNLLSPDLQPSDPPKIWLVDDQWYGAALGLEIGRQEVIIDSYKQRPDLCLADLDRVNWMAWGRQVKWACEELAVK